MTTNGNANNQQETHESGEQTPEQGNENTEHLNTEHEVANESAETEVPLEETLEDKYKKLELALAEVNDRMLRAVAESENIKRRAAIDIAKARDFSVESFAKDMVSALDNLFRATDSVDQAQFETNEALKSLFDGVEMTKKEFLTAMERQKIVRIDPKGEKFDHNLHQAMSQVPSEEHEPNTVLEVIQAGYQLKDRLLRPAMVVVTKKA